ncbi:adenosylcobinamide amidohydrolase, partial [Streptomyces sp. SP18CS02]|uniref:adenosylcobinamide amidohydrolase n=1 Tax=Streptomyces sp. SP18CS02 TaxID=3002531 RepID=UPI002E75B374
VLGGGVGERAWVLNAQVAHGYRRTDPARHLARMADAAGARWSGVGRMTAADVSGFAQVLDGGVEAVATAGVTVRGWAASPAEGTPVPAKPGTINVIAAVPVALSDA